MQTPASTTSGVTVIINNHANASIQIDRADDKRENTITIKPITGNTNTLTPPALNPGETYAGKITFEDGTGYHLILLPGDNDDANWKKQMEWAASIGGELPDRVEGALLYARFKKEFKEEWYWTREQHASASDCAWNQSFLNGDQYYDLKGYEFRARAVRRVAI